MNIINRLIGRIFNKTVKRKQFNLTINEEIIEGVKSIAAVLEVPRYVILEHLLQIGSHYLLKDLDDPERRESLQLHLVKAHLLGLESDEAEILAK